MLSSAVLLSATPPRPLPPHLSDCPYARRRSSSSSGGRFHTAVAIDELTSLLWSCSNRVANHVTYPDTLTEIHPGTPSWDSHPIPYPCPHLTLARTLNPPCRAFSLSRRRMVYARLPGRSFPSEAPTRKTIPTYSNLSKNTERSPPQKATASARKKKQDHRERLGKALTPGGERGRKLPWKIAHPPSAKSRDGCRAWGARPRFRSRSALGRRKGNA